MEGTVDDDEIQARIEGDMRLESCFLWECWHGVLFGMVPC